MRCLPCGDRLQHAVDGVVLVVARLPRAAAGPRRARRRSGRARRSASAKVAAQSSSGVGIARDVALRAGLHVDAVDAEAVGGVGEARLQLARRSPWPAPTPSVAALVPRLGLDHRQLVVAVDQHVVGDVSGLPRRPRPSMRPGVIGTRAGPGCRRPRPSRPPAARGRCSSARVSASFIGRLFDARRSRSARRRRLFAGATCFSRQRVHFCS